MSKDDVASLTDLEASELTLDNLEDMDRIEDMKLIEDMERSDDEDEALQNTSFLESPEYKIDSKLESKVTACRTCKRRLDSKLMVDGECPLCAMRRMRKIEESLAALKQLKPVHKYCLLEGHRLASENKLYPEWNGMFNINGVKLYPVQPLCARCIDTITAFLVMYLEQRGILRKGLNHNDNEFGRPYKVKLSTKETLEARTRLQSFIQSISVDVLDPETATYSVLKDIRDTRKALMKKKATQAQTDALNKDKEDKERWSEQRKELLRQNKENPRLLPGLEREDAELAMNLWKKKAQAQILTAEPKSREEGEELLQNLQDSLTLTLNTVFDPADVSVASVEEKVKTQIALCAKSPLLLALTK